MALAWGACACPGAQADPSLAAATADERLVFSVDGSTLSSDGGGSGGSATWLHYFGAGNVLGAGAEYQQIANAHWTTGALSGSVGLGHSQARPRLYAEVHAGGGDIGTHAFNYLLAVAGVFGTLTPRFSVQLEERRIDIDTSHGNLPKLGLLFKVTSRLLATASYAHSAGGNLGTRLSSLRLDYAGSEFGGMAGVVWGPATPAAFNLFGQNLTPGSSLSEGFAGVTRSVGRTQWLVVGDYQNVAGTRRATLTLNCAHTLRGPSQTQ